MNTMENININANAVNTTAEVKQPAASTTNWLLFIAGFLFWTVVFFQFMALWHDEVEQEFIDFVIYNAFPLIGTLAYFGIRKEQKAIATGNSANCDAEKNDC